MTREEHVAAAEAIARDNPEWTWDASWQDLTHLPSLAVVWMPHVHLYWKAAPAGGKPSFARFHSPADAIRSLGFTLATETPDAR